MKKVNVAIDGFGRIGRIALRLIIDNPYIEVKAINDLTDANTLKHLFKYDSVHGVFAGEVSVEGDYLLIKNKKIIIRRIK